jgi:EAL domain-containing protein (putative c-di-GMP-specific phosphodiesterase class I)
MRTRENLAKPKSKLAAQPPPPPRIAKPIVGSDARFLAFTFAFADVVVEFDEDWHVLYGMMRTENGPAPYRARTLSDVVDPASLGKVMPLAKLGSNLRADPVTVMLKFAGGRREAVLRAFRSRDLGARLSCIFTFPDEAAGLVGAPGRTPVAAAAAPKAVSAPAARNDRVLNSDDLLDCAARVLEQPRSFLGQLYFTFVELTGLLHTAGRSLSPAAEKAVAELEVLLQKSSVGGKSAGKIKHGRYVVLTDDRVALPALVKAIDALGEDVAAMLAPRASQAAVADPGSPTASIRALRFAVDRFFAKEGSPDVATLATELSATLKDAGDFRVAIKDRMFKLAYQPIVRLSDEKVAAFEALLRLPGKDNIAASVRMAEQLGLIDAVDVAVAEAAWSVLEHDRTRELSICINISGKALRDDGYIQGLINMTKRSQSMRNRFTIEITEASALEDLDGADRRVQSLRRMGFRVCVDDFGAGAASFDYLRALNVDVIKIDGRYVREVAVNEKARLLVQHFVRLCNVLKIETVGARTETAAAARTLKDLGVHYAQGWYYGHPLDEPRVSDPARRKGEQEEWR